jgi:hypothetical protein
MSAPGRPSWAFPWLSSVLPGKLRDGTQAMLDSFHPLLNLPFKITVPFDDTSLQQNLSWEDNTRSSSQNILRLSWITKTHYRVHKSPSMGPMDPARLISPGSVLILIPRSPNEAYYLPSIFPTKMVYGNLIYLTRREDNFQPIIAYFDGCVTSVVSVK